MKKILSLICVAALCVSVAAGCNDANVTEATDSYGINVTTSQAVVGDIDTTATYTGSLTTDDFAFVTSKVSAKVKTINAEIGDWVNKGQVLVVLDSSDYEYQLSQAEASYAQAEAAYNSALTAQSNVGGAAEQSKAQLEQALNSAKLAYDNAKTNFDRQKQLYDMGAISLAAYENAKMTLDNARLAYESAQKNYDIMTNVITPGNHSSAQSGVETAQAAKNVASLAVNQARENIANTRITAPISGYVSQKNVANGQFASAGMTLFTISDSSDLQAEISVTEAVIPYVKVGSRALVNVTSANLSVECEVSVVNPVKDSMTGMYTVRIAVPNEDDSLKIGMFADITLYTEQSAKNVICIPADAIMQEGDEYYVYVAEGDKAVKKVVKVGVTNGETTEITEGLQLGEAVICEGKEYLSEKNNLINVVD